MVVFLSPPSVYSDQPSDVNVARELLEQNGFVSASNVLISIVDPPRILKIITVFPRHWASCWTWRGYRCSLFSAIKDIFILW